MRQGDIPVEGGAYQLLFRIDEPVVIRVPPKKPRRTGDKVFKLRPGYYCYTGSALGGLAGRIRRHLQQSKKLFWDVDFLRRVAGPPVRIAWRVSRGAQECHFAALALSMAGVRAVVRSDGSDSRNTGFGNSGCAGRCESHLVCLATDPGHLPVEVRSASRFPRATPKKRRRAEAPFAAVPRLHWLVSASEPLKQPHQTQQQEETKGGSAMPKRTERMSRSVACDERGKIIPTDAALRAVERDYPDAPPLEKRRLAQAQTLIDAFVNRKQRPKRRRGRR